ncbi:hypothetical protein [Mycobacterium sp. HNNTM2301]|uniref:hypothetical protein n=1 Tax=Mycobacterium hainanense TaxID=3289775 RepID=UPI0035A709C0
MSSNWVPTLGTVIVALLGFAGVLIAQVIANRRADKEWERERYREEQRWERETQSRRRREFAEAIADYASAVTSLRRAEFNRGRQRIDQLPETKHELAKQETYQLRVEAESKRFMVVLLADRENDQDLLTAARDVIEKCHQISAVSESMADLQSHDLAAKEALDELIEEASRRV